MSPDGRVQTEDSANSDEGFSRNLDKFRRKERERRLKRSEGRIFLERLSCVCAQGREKSIHMWLGLCQCVCIPVFPHVKVL